MIDRLKAAHNSSPHPMRIWVDNLDVQSLGDDHFLVIYEEWQDDGEEKKGRVSSGILRRKEGLPNNLEWLRVHETWLPESR